MRLAIAMTAALISCTACSRRDLRGTISSSKDGKTYLVIADDNGGHCGPMKVDGKIWPHAIGEAGRIEPGDHSIECGAEMGINVPPGVVYTFDYWGP